MKLLTNPLFIFNVCRLFCIKKFTVCYFKIPDIFFRSGHVIKSLSCFCSFLLLFFCASTFASSHDDLFFALREGNIKRVEILMQSKNIGIDTKLDLEIDSSDNYNTPLATATLYGHIGLVKHLIERGADVNAKNFYDRTALMYAVEGRYQQIIALLLANGADINAQDKYGSTPLMWAIERGYTDIVNFLIQRGANLNLKDKSHDQTALMLAVRKGYIDIVNIFLNDGADVNTKTDEGDTLLRMAISNEHPETALLLIQNGADVNFIEKASYITPLWLAAGRGQTQVVELLLKYGADLNAKDKCGRTPLKRAMLGQHAETVAFLISQGAKEK